MSITRYELILHNSICDIVEVKKDTKIFNPSFNSNMTLGKDLWGVTYAHINPNDPFEDRRIYVWIPESFEDYFDFIELSLNFEISPRLLLDLVQENSFKIRFFKVHVKDLELIYPNMIKGTKILNDGSTFATVKKDLENPRKNSSKVSKEEFQKMGHVTGFDLSQNNPILVSFPYKPNEWHRVKDLYLYHNM